MYKYGKYPHNVVAFKQEEHTKNGKKMDKMIKPRLLKCFLVLIIINIKNNIKIENPIIP